VRIASISVDLDEIPNYHLIHGLREPRADLAHLVYDRALGRLRDFAAKHSIPLTLFVIGSDLTRRDNASALREMARLGHELGNHSLDHMYDFSRLARAGIRTQIEGGILAIERATGVTPRGFRAPGYTVNDQVFDVLRDVGVLYDSSVFPCPPYYLAKASALAAIGLRGRTSRSILDDPRVLQAPTRPYKVGRPYWLSSHETRAAAVAAERKPNTKGAAKDDAVLELPIQVTPGLRLPFIGTALTLAGPLAATALTRMCASESFVNLELHGIDLLDASDGLDALAMVQPDVRVPLGRKLATLDAVVRTLRKHGFTFQTLAEAAVEVRAKA
jgi:peptidoglycan-N-acetylglucosamine deacetylase